MLHGSLGRRKIERLIEPGYAKNDAGLKEGQRNPVAASHPPTVLQDHALPCECETDAGRGTERRQDEHASDVDAPHHAV